MKNLLLTLLRFFLLAAPLEAVAQQSGDFTYTSDGSAITISKFTGFGGAVTVPQFITGLPVRTIGDGAFQASHVTSVNIPISVLYIGYSAFESCTHLIAVNVSGNVASIGGLAFYGCTSLTNMTIPVNVSTIGDLAFAGCTNLDAINVDPANPSYSSLDGVLFNKSQTSLVECPGGKAGAYSIPGSVVSIGSYAFASCNGLTHITIPSSVINIAFYAFSSCTSLTSITMPGSITNIGNYAFSACLNLTNATISDGILGIGSDAFSGCASLTSFTVPGSVTNIGDFVFEACTSLKAIGVDPSNAQYSSLDGVLFDKRGTTLIACPGAKAGAYSIPGTVLHIGAASFQGCTALTSVTVPSSVTSIGYETFFRCIGLTNIMIPGSVTEIGDEAFSWCTGLHGVFFQGNAPAYVGSNVFLNDDETTVYCLPGTIGWGPTFGGRPVVLWNPLMPSSGVGPAGFGFIITGTPDIPIVIEAATTLANPTWVPLQNLSLTNGAFHFTDPDCTNCPARFYRIRSP